MDRALEYASLICDKSPDAILSTKKALLVGLQHGGVDEATDVHLGTDESIRVYVGDNIKVCGSHLASERFYSAEPIRRVFERSQRLVLPLDLSPQLDSSNALTLYRNVAQNGPIQNFDSSLKHVHA